MCLHHAPAFAAEKVLAMEQTESVQMMVAKLQRQEKSVWLRFICGWGSGSWQFSEELNTAPP